MRSFPFTAQSGDRKVTTADFRELFKKYFTNGIFINPSTNFQVLENSGMTLTVKKGWGNINGTFAYSNEDITLNLQSAESNPRIDRVVLRFNDNVEERKINVYVVKGIASINPTAPALTRSESIYELSLATIYVNSYATNITQSKITDTRLDDSVCGVVAGTIKEADTTTLYTQIQNDLKGFKQNEQEEFIKWFNQIKGQLSTDQAGNLQNQIDEIKPKLEKNTKYLNGLAPINLLVNGDFKINQRGKTEYTSGPDAYTVDMWRKGGSVLNVIVDGIKISTIGNSSDGRFGQKVGDMKFGEKYTAIISVKSLQGNASINTATSFVNSYNTAYELKNGLNTFNITTQGDWLVLTMHPNTVIEIEYIDLFEGDVAYPHIKENGSIALYRCQDHILGLNLITYSNLFGTITYYENKWRGLLFNHLKKNPSVMINGDFTLYAVKNRVNLERIKMSNLTINIQTGEVDFFLEKTSSFPIGETGLLQSSGNASIILTCEPL